LKAMTAPDSNWGKGVGVEAAALAFRVFRNNKLVYQSATSGERHHERISGHV
jgi:putative spermidine/putrescine transport system ATP-binding protein